MAKSKQGGRNWNRIGVSQGERFSKALLPDYVRIDERSTADLLAFASDFARLVRYYDSNNNVDGNWEPFLIHDISVFLSIISVTDIQSLNEEERNILETLSNSYGLDLYRELYRLFELTHRVMSTINKWYIVARELNTSYSGEPEGIEIELEHAIENQLNDYFVVFRAYEREAGFEERLGKQYVLSYAGFSPIWDMEEDEERFMPKDKPVHERISVGVKKVRVLFRRFHRVLAHIVFRAKNYYLKQSITDNAGHQPHVAMLIAFMELFGYAQEHINEITTRHLNHYYHQILRQTPKPLVPDKVHLHFQLAHHLETTLLPEGTTIISNEDDSIVFATDDDLVLSKAHIAELKTIFIGRNPLIGIGSSFKLVSDFYATSVANSKDGMGKPFYQDEEPVWPTFGERQYDKVQEDYNMFHADMGFAISSPVLLMKEGERKIELSLNFERASGNTLYRLIKDISKNNGTLKEESFHQISTDAFNISITTEEGWLMISNYEVSQLFSSQLMTFFLEFSLDFAAPSIQANPECGFDSNYPVIRLLLNDDAIVYPYSFLKDLVLNSVGIDVWVWEMKELVVYNQLGELDASIPFEPFGSNPKVGSYLLIGNEEIFQKPLMNLEIEMEWFDLPKDSHGFEEYYETYDEGITNDSFKVLLTALSDNKFTTPRKTEEFTFNLFASGEGMTGPVLEKTMIDGIPVSKLGIRPEPDFKLDSKYDNGTRTGFLRLELCNPPMAFGHDLFPKVYAQVSQYNGTPKISGIGMLQKVTYPDPLPVPKNPYTPIIKKLSINYAASVQINLNDARQSSEIGKIPEKIFHVHPFGNVTTFKGNRASNHHFMPQYNDAGNLFIGLENLRPLEEISFYFELKENLLMDATRQRPQANWYCLSNNKWMLFLKKNILVDTTENFTTSGIVKLKVPKEITKGNQLLNPELFWLSIGVRKNVHLLAKCLIIKTQGVSASRVSHAMGNIQRVKKDMLLSFPIRMSSVREIFQPFPSFGGRGKESSKEFYFRVSERLRHKSRAVTEWDYERLVLENFPEIHQVKCISIAENDSSSPQHATVKVVVVPQLKAAGVVNYFEPKADYFLLNRIKEFLKGYCSPFANVEVVNPVYEKLKISCGVIFTKGNNNGTHLEKLNMEIRKFINPWMFGVNVNLQLGGTLVKDELLTVIQRLPYVKFITSFSIVQVIQENGKYRLADTARDVSTIPTLQASTPWAILVPSLDNPIAFLERHAFQEPKPATVDTLMIGTDFVIHGEDDELLERADYYMANFMGREETEKTDLRVRYFLDIPLDFDDDDED